MNILSGKGKLGHRFNNHVRAAGSRIADDDAWRQQREINELAAVHGKVLDLDLADDGISGGARGLNQRGFRGDGHSLFHLAR